MEIAVLIGLILLNGVFAMAELAILTAKRVRLETAAEQGDDGAKQALKLADNPNRSYRPFRLALHPSVC